MATNVATLSELRTPAVPAAQMPVRAGFFDAAGFELMQRVAKAFAASSLVPKDYVGNVANCMIAINMAERIGADPMMVMQNLYVVHGRPGWSSQFLIATFNHCGRFSAVRYRWQGTPGKDDWGCRAWSKELATGEEIVGPLVTIALAKGEGWYGKSGSKWQTIPELMLMYRAAGWMIRTHAPEIAMGLQTSEELADTFDATRDEDGGFRVDVDTLRAEETARQGTTIDAQATTTDAGQQPPPTHPDAPEDGERPDTQRPERPSRATNKATGETSGPAPSYAAVDLAIRAATNTDDLDAAVSLIPSVQDVAHQATLRTAADKRRAELGK